MDNKNDHQSRFLEAPFVRMLRMRSASLKMNSFLRFVEEFTAWQFAFEVNWRLQCTETLLLSMKTWKTTLISLPRNIEFLYHLVYITLCCMPMQSAIFQFATPSFDEFCACPSSQSTSCFLDGQCEELWSKSDKPYSSHFKI